MTDQTALARRYKFEVDMNYPSTAVWTLVPGRVEFKPNDTPTDQRDSDYDSNGNIGYTRTAGEWGVELKLSFKEDDTTFAQHATHTYIRGRAFSRFGKGSILHFRYYDRNGNTDAWEGYGVVTWAPDGGDDEQLDRVAITIKPSSVSPALVQITNPANATPVPVITSLSPATGGTAGGNLVTISGAYFTGVTGATGVKFGANNATNYAVVSDSKIVATAPAGAAGAVRVSVTNANGTSVDTAADDYTYA